VGKAGSSARARARQLTTDKVKSAKGWVIAGAVGGGLLGLSYNPGAGAAGAVLGVAGGATVGLRGVREVGQRWRQGAAGEARTGKIVRRLGRDGWYLFDDRSIPRSKANLDHVWVHPSGQAVIVGDTKAWHANKAPVRMRGNDLYYGPWCKTDNVNTIRWETSRVRDALGVHVISILVLDGARIDRGSHPGGWIEIDSTFYVVEQGGLVDTLRSIQGTSDARRARRLAKQVDRQFPSYK
jgi:hypothetical protein